ncbi:MAG: acyl-CoA dehydrogenase family protein [Dehalococcoidia bacterium]
MVMTPAMARTMFQLPPELNEIKLLTRKIVKEQCIPLEDVLLHSDPSSTDEGGGEIFIEGSIGKENHDRLKQISQETGIYSMHLPEAYGGSGFGVLGNFVVDEERNRSLVHLPVAYVPNILFDCDDWQKERYLLPVMRGEKRTCFAQTEPDAGSDPGNSMRTRAVRDGDDWVLNGTKMYISGADTADFLMLLAVTDPDKRQRGGITMFLVDKDLPGLGLRPIGIWTTPSRPHQFYVDLDNVRVPASNVLGEVGGGFRLGQRWLVIHDRLSRGSLACGILTRGIEMATEWAKNRVTFGEPLAQRQAIQWMLVDCYIDLKCIRAMSYECAARADAGEDVRVLGSLSKLLGANWGHRSIDKIMQIFGGMGETMDLPITAWYRMLRHGRIGGGTDEIHRMLIARNLLNIGVPLWEA